LLQPFARERILKIFNGVELDTAAAQKLQRAARIPSARVVNQRYPFHLALVDRVRGRSDFD
jgi:hypothetical protein